MTEDIKGLMPVIWPIVAALGILVTCDTRKHGPKPLPPLLAVMGMVMSLASIWVLWPQDISQGLFKGAVRLDNFGLYLATLICFCTIGTIMASVDYLKRREKNLSEFYALVLFSSSGMMLMGLSTNFITLLFGLEMMSIAFYVLVGFFRERAPSVEASIKYYLTGSFATGLLIFGLAFIYGGTGSLDLSGIGIEQAGGASSPLLVLGLGFVIAGLGFKIAAAPFHMWLPDVYEGAPTTVTGFMASGVKIAAFGMLIRLFCEVYQSESSALRDTLWWIALGTMAVGNVAALAQKSVKRMLAYSSIAHAGYLLVALVVMQGTPDETTGMIDFSGSSAIQGILYYLLAYAVANIGAFAVLSYLEKDAGGGLDYDDLAGLKSKQPFLALALSAFMLSLAGIPGTAGFIGKYNVFAAAVEGSQSTADQSFMLLAVLGILNSLVGLYYYLRVPIQLYAKELPEDKKHWVMPARSLAFRLVIGGSVLGTLWLGFGPDVMNFGVEPAMQMVQSALASLR
ncbi:MAG: NADH-quinone oxidoreductase subunit N [Planctomycetota bacterium]|jgi:NADH-quinone oxidoreductase subunit N